MIEFHDRRRQAFAGFLLPFGRQFPLPILRTMCERSS